MIGLVLKEIRLHFILYSKQRLQLFLLSLSIIKRAIKTSFNSTSCADKSKMLAASPVAVACRWAVKKSTRCYSAGLSNVMHVHIVSIDYDMLLNT